MINDSRIVVERLSPPASRDDREAIIAIEAESFSNPWTERTFDAMLDTPLSEVFVARGEAGRILAFCACWVIGDELHINTLAVHEPRRRQGIAHTLLQRVLALTRSTRATLEVRRSNEAALALYRKLGFQVTAVRPNYYQNPQEDGLILWRNP